MRLSLPRHDSFTHQQCLSAGADGGEEAVFPDPRMDFFACRKCLGIVYESQYASRRPLAVFLRRMRRLLLTSFPSAVLRLTEATR